VTFFDDVTAMTSLNDVIINFLKFDFVIISLKTLLCQITELQVTKFEVAEPPTLDDF